MGVIDICIVITYKIFITLQSKFRGTLITFIFSVKNGVLDTLITLTLKIWGCTTLYVVLIYNKSLLAGRLYKLYTMKKSKRNRALGSFVEVFANGIKAGYYIIMIFLKIAGNDN